LVRLDRHGASGRAGRSGERFSTRLLVALALCRFVPRTFP